MIAAAAPHRAEVFTACRAMIDRLKERVPTWKKAVGTQGEEWVCLADYDVERGAAAARGKVFAPD